LPRAAVLLSAAAAPAPSGEPEPVLSSCDLRVATASSLSFDAACVEVAAAAATFYARAASARACRAAVSARARQLNAVPPRRRVGRE